MMSGQLRSFNRKTKRNAEANGFMVNMPKQSPKTCNCLIKHSFIGQISVLIWKRSYLDVSLLIQMFANLISIKKHSEFKWSRLPLMTCFFTQILYGIRLTLRLLRGFTCNAQRRLLGRAPKGRILYLLSINYLCKDTYPMFHHHIGL